MRSLVLVVFVLATSCATMNHGLTVRSQTVEITAGPVMELPGPDSSLANAVVGGALDVKYGLTDDWNGGVGAHYFFQSIVVEPYMLYRFRTEWFNVVPGLGLQYAHTFGDDRVDGAGRINNLVAPAFSVALGKEWGPWNPYVGLHYNLVSLEAYAGTEVRLDRFRASLEVDKVTFGLYGWAVSAGLGWQL